MSGWVRPLGSELKDISSERSANFVFEFTGEIDTWG